MRITKPKDVKNFQYYFIGLIFIVLNYIRNTLFGYRTPRNFSVYQIDRTIDYDLQVVDRWVKFLKSYSEGAFSLNNKVILELGPGPDLGIGLILLAMGVKKYIAIDVNELAKSTPWEFYKKLLDKLKECFPGCDINDLEDQLRKCYKGAHEKIQYIVDSNFELSRIKDEIDVVFSHATFQHFTNVEKTFRELNSIVKVGGVLISTIGLCTQTRWIRDKDPLNIYRYGDFVWNLFKFNGSPNRIRAFEYKKLLEITGWCDVKIEPFSILEDEYVDKVKPTLYKKFKDLDSSELRMLAITLMANKNLQ